ncbi:ATPase [Sphingorhabdus sp.]|jgi:F-type H+-transporting ATPase subunit b|uniref:F0F1 ATP synthase subunit B family protein n=1 Tax=Sphingorhabdus sp. TaxID=1902408 RepID=UPI0037CB6313
MPQIAQILETYASQFFWLMIVFGLVYFTIGHGMLPKVEATVDARNRKIADDLAAAELARAEADDLGDSGEADLTAARTAAQAKSASAKAKAAKDADARLAKADAEISAKIAAADAELAKATAKALSDIETVAAEAAADIVAKVSGAKITSAQAAKAVKAVMSHG